MTTPLASTSRLKDVLSVYFHELDDAARTHSAPVAWCSSVGPVELLRALGYRVFFPENHSAMLGAARTANHYMTRAHALGYSPDSCSYLSSDVGAYLSGETALARYGIAEVPHPDVLVFNTNQCRDVRDWFDYYAREWDVPAIGITSFRCLDRIEQDHVDAIALQHERLVAPLEAIAGRRLDAPNLEETLRLSREGSGLWRAVLETATHRPSPLSFFEATIQMAPAVVLRGTEEACAYYRLLLAELQDRVSRKVAAVSGERFRIYWEGMPIWGKLRALSELFESLRTCVVASTYCNSWIFDALDPADPFRSMARSSLELFIVRAEQAKERYLEQMAGQYQVDGLLFHDCRTCPNNSNSRYGMPGRLRERLGLPVLSVDGDVNDLRCYSEEQSMTSIEGFVEQLAEAF
ncbi:MAG: 2-hydroxyacyl-CoA dehydratase [Candidatus Eisenbacteria bacterium]|uniref:2-hydroxyacyl-CoA dehydratase n=1 Tax=Eiseniibacteriota bacterium TaxID=2212470 RepID=A0A956RMT3_UNCEI|nr:2-hydroxyacyl-CoA dehydratase [Candidatus Eisenbacteria bacterium]